MADNLICLDFYGLPGSGKTVVSHKIAEAMRLNGHLVKEASYQIDSRQGRLGRIAVKTWYSICFMASHFSIYKALCEKVRECGYRGRDRFVQKVNLLYKFHALYSFRRGVLVFDEGVIQSSISLSMLGKKSAVELFLFFRELFPKVRYRAVHIHSDVDMALDNMCLRKSNDSRVERLDNLSARRKMLESIKTEVDGFDHVLMDVLSIEGAGMEHLQSILSIFDG